MHPRPIQEELLLTSKELHIRSRQMAINKATRFCKGSNRVFLMGDKEALTTQDGRSVSLIRTLDLRVITINKDNWSRRIIKTRSTTKAIQKRTPLILRNLLLTAEIIICSPTRKLMSLITKISWVPNTSLKLLECWAIIPWTLLLRALIWKQHLLDSEKNLRAWNTLNWDLANLM